MQAKLTPFLRSCGYNPKKDVIFVPISGLFGSNIKERVDPKLCPWYTGGTLFEVCSASWHHYAGPDVAPVCRCSSQCFNRDNRHNTQEVINKFILKMISIETDLQIVWKTGRQFPSLLGGIKVTQSMC